MPDPGHRVLYLILLGGPGAGKGTQGQLLSTYLGIQRISSGDLFREHVRSRTELGLTAKAYMDRGELVPDLVTVAMVTERLAQLDCVRGAILDGFPRTLPQAEALEAALYNQGKSIAQVLDLCVDMSVLVERLAGRWICRVCGAAFHNIFRPPVNPGQCDHCGNALFQRDDDRPETVVQRLEVYARQTAPLQAFYRQRGILVRIDGSLEVDDVQLAMRQAIVGAELFQNR